MRKFAKPAGAGLALQIVALGAACLTLVSCVRLGSRDAFPVGARVIGLPALQALAGAGNDIRPLQIAVNGRAVDAYHLRRPHSQGTVIFFGGSGNQVDAALQVVGPRTAALGLDLVVFSYYREGERVPSVSQVRAGARAVYAAVRATRTPASRKVYVIGYSLGGWFALDVAANDDVRGLILVGAETTPAEVIRRTVRPWASLVALRPDADARQLDASLYAPHVRTRTLVVTSKQDEAVPAAVGEELYGMLPASTPKRLLELDGVTHGRYLLSDELWREVAVSFDLSAKS